MSHNSVVVAEEGNRRVGDMTRDEIEQCVLDIKSWFQRSSRVMDDTTGASSTDFQRLSKAVDAEVPVALRTLLSECNGGIWLMEKKLLSVEAIIDLSCKHSRSQFWKDDMIPIAEDGSGGDEILIYRAKNGEIYEWDEDNGLSEDPVARNFSRYLEEYRNHLLNGHYEFVEGVGLIEHVGNKSHSPQKSRK